MKRALSRLGEVLRGHFTRAPPNNFGQEIGRCLGFFQALNDYFASTELVPSYSNVLSDAGSRPNEPRVLAFWPACTAGWCKSLIPVHLRCTRRSRPPPSSTTGQVVVNSKPVHTGVVRLAPLVGSFQPRAILYIASRGSVSFDLLALVPLEPRPCGHDLSNEHHGHLVVAHPPLWPGPYPARALPVAPWHHPWHATLPNFACPSQSSVIAARDSICPSCTTVFLGARSWHVSSRLECHSFPVHVSLPVWL